MSFGSRDVIVAKLHARVQVVFIKFGGLPQLFKGFLKTLESFVGTGQTPVSRRKSLVDLDGVAKLERGLLKLFVLQVDFTLCDVGYFGFFGIAATAYCK